MNSETNFSSKQKKRIRKQERRRHPEISKDIIKIWEELRQKSLKAENKHALCEKIINQSKTVIIELIKQKVTARVFQSVIEFGLTEHRWTIFEIIKKDLLSLCKEKYAHFSVISMLKYGTKEQRLSVFELFKGKVVELLQHSFACKVVEVAYNELANATQRGQMIQEFYGKTFLLLKGEKEIKHLSDFTSNSSYDMSILQNLHKLLVPIVRKGQIDLSIVQHVLYEYVNVLLLAKKQESEDLAKPYVTLFDELVELMQENLLKLCNTRKGSKVAILIFYEYSTKIRKKIVQSCKDIIVNLCSSEHSHLFLMAVIDQLDDTKLLDKSIIKPIMENIDEIMGNVHGRKIIHFLLCHRDSRMCPKFTLELLKMGDGNPHSKKDVEIRTQEIVDFCTIPMVKWLSTKIEEALKYTYSINITNSIMTKCLPKTEATKASYLNILEVIVAHIDEPIIPSETPLKRKAKPAKTVPKKKAKNFTGSFENCDDKKSDEANNEEENLTVLDSHLIESVGGNVLVKSLCKLEKEGLISGFSELCIKSISLENMLTFIGCNRAAFFLVFLFEVGNESVQLFMKENFKHLAVTMSTSELPGVKILYRHLFGQ